MHGRVIAVAAAMLLALPGTAAAEWEQPWSLTPLDLTATANGPAVALDGSGRATAVWAQTATPGDSTSFSARTARLPAGAEDWTFTGTPISAGGVQAMPNSDGWGSMAIDVTDAGGAVATWMSGPPGPNREIDAVARATFDGAFGGVKRLTDPGLEQPDACPNQGEDPFGPLVTMGASGNGHVVWWDACNFDDSVLARTIQGGALTNDNFFAGAFSARNTLDTLQSAPVATDPTDSQTGVAYMRGANGGGDVGPMTALLDSIGVVADSPIQHEQSVHARRARIAFVENGQRVAAWIGANNRARLQIGTNTPVDLSAEGDNVQRIELAAGADGTAVVMWAANSVWYASVRPPAESGAAGAGTFGAPFVMLEEGGFTPRLAIADNGVGYCVYLRNDGSGRLILEGRILDPEDPDRSPGEPWQFQPTADIVFDAFPGVQTGSAQTPSLAVAPDGSAVVVGGVAIGASSTHNAVYAVRHPSPRDGGEEEPPPDDGGGDDGSGGGDPPPAEPPAEPPPPGFLPPPPPPGPGPPLAAPDTTRPRITAVSLSRRYFGPGRREGQELSDAGERTAMGRSGGLRAGAKIRFTLTEAASVRLVLRQSGCWNSNRATRRRCRPRDDGDAVWSKTVRAGRRGANTVRYDGDGVVSGGEYVLTLVATDPAGNRSAPRRYPRILGDQAR